jgi:hypothetical protein
MVKAWLKTRIRIPLLLPASIVCAAPNADWTNTDRALPQRNSNMGNNSAASNDTSNPPARLPNQPTKWRGMLTATKATTEERIQAGEHR